MEEEIPDKRDPAGKRRFNEAPESKIDPLEDLFAPSLFWQDMIATKVLLKKICRFCTFKDVISMYLAYDSSRSEFRSIYRFARIVVASEANLALAWNSETDVSYFEPSGELNFLAFLQKFRGHNHFKDSFGKPVEVVANEVGGGAAVFFDGECLAFDVNEPGKCRRLAKKARYVVNNNFAFVALFEDGTVGVWGDERYGGSLSEETAEVLTDVKDVEATEMAFCALTRAGAFHSWGCPIYGGAFENTHGYPVKEIVPTDGAFGAIDVKGYVTLGGNPLHGGYAKPCLLKEQYKDLQASSKSFYGIKLDGSEVKLNV